MAQRVRTADSQKFLQLGKRGQCVETWPMTALVLALSRFRYTVLTAPTFFPPRMDFTLSN